MLARQNAKFSVTQIQKLKKLKVTGYLEQEKKLQEAQKRKMEKLWKKRIEMINGIEQRIDSASLLTQQY